MPRTVDELVAKFSLKTNFAKEIGSTTKELGGLRRDLIRAETPQERFAKRIATSKKLLDAGEISLKDYRQQVDRLRQSILKVNKTPISKRIGAGLRGGLGRARGVIGGGLGALGVGVGVGAIAGGISAEIDRTASQADTADKLGIGIQGLLTIQTAAERTGMSAEAAATALQRLGRRSAEGSKATEAAFKRLGLNMKEMAKLPVDQQFFKITEAMRGITNQNEKMAIAMKLFDTEGVGLVNTMEMGTAGLNAIGREVSGLAQFREQNAKHARKAQEELQRFNMQLQLLAVQTLPYVSSALEGLTSIGSGQTTEGKNTFTESLKNFFTTGSYAVENRTQSEGLVQQNKKLDEQVALLREMVNMERQSDIQRGLIDAPSGGIN